MRLRRIPTTETFVEPWKNGLGSTDILAEARIPGAPTQGWDGLVWRIARTSIPTPLAFSDLSGYDRHQVVIDGDGLYLDSADGTIDLSRAFVPVQYSGDLKLDSRLANGPVGVLNFMLARQLAEGRMAVVHERDTVTLGHGRHLLVATNGPVTLTVDGAPHALADGETLDIDLSDAPPAVTGSQPTAGARIAIRSGLAVLCSVHRRPTAT